MTTERSTSSWPLASTRQSSLSCGNHWQPITITLRAPPSSPREIVRGVNPRAILSPSVCPRHIHPFTRTCSCPSRRRRASMAGSRWSRRKARASFPTKIRRSPRRLARWPAWPTKTRVSSRSCRHRPNELREHEEQTDFAMTAARSGVSYRDLGSSSRRAVAIDRHSCLAFAPDVRRVSQDELYERVHPEDAQLDSCGSPEGYRGARREFALEFRLIMTEDGPALVSVQRPRRDQ